MTIPWILSLLLRIAMWSVTEPTLMSGLVEKVIDVIPDWCEGGNSCGARRACSWGVDT